MELEFQDIKFLSVDIDQIPAIAQQHRVRALPALILFKNGHEVNRINGLVLTSPLRTAFKDLAKSSD